ncbi:MAG: MMPL family transporter, partial [Thiogranum sp.]|nr:MMPL family transporter [Thiogranum sp.]
MISVRQRAGLWVTVAIAAVAVCALFLSRGAPLQTDLLALLPPTERDRAAEQAVDALNEAMGKRVVFLVSHSDESTAGVAAAHFADALKHSGAFERVVGRMPPLDPELPIAFYGPHRFGLLTDADRDTLVAGDFDAGKAALQRLISPMGAGFATPVAEDPFGFFARWLSSRPTGAGTLSLIEGFLMTRDSEHNHVLVLADLDGSAFDSDVQSRALEGLQVARKALRDSFPEARVLRTGTVFYAAAARSDAEHDVNRIALGSILGISILFFLMFRSLRALLLGLFTVSIGIAMAMSAILLSQGQLHL